MRKLNILWIFLLIGPVLTAQKINNDKKEIIASVEKHEQALIAISDSI